MNRETGAALSGDDHIAQSVRDILTTSVGSRVMRRDYGSEVPNLIDAPFNPSTQAMFYAAVAEALRLWEPRLTLQSVRIAPLTAIDGQAGRVSLSIKAVKVADGKPFEMGVSL